MSSLSKQTPCWAIVPAAGVGRRMGSDCPKQYLLLNQQPILSHTLAKLAAVPAVTALVVALSPEDEYWPDIDKPDNIPLHTVNGGAERCHSVLNALTFLEGRAQDDDWVLVHDAARPCVKSQDVAALLAHIQAHPAGGLLALPMTDTVKRMVADQDVAQVATTVDRSSLWRALTPQVFRFKLLKTALTQALDNDQWVTDESQAIELAGYQPLLLTGSADNIKVTNPQDLALAALYLQQQQQD